MKNSDRAWTAAIFCVVLFSVTILAKPVSNAPATSTIADTDPGTGAVYRIGSDGLGSYLSSVDSVKSNIQAIGDWELDLKLSPVRRARVDLGDPVPGSNPNPPFQAAFLPVRFISKCTDANVFLPGLAVGQQATCPLSLNFDYNGVNYALRANTLHPGTEFTQWTCLARNATKCVSFRMRPSVVQSDGERKIIMQLVRPATRRVPEQSLGFFYMSYDVAVTTP